MTNEQIIKEIKEAMALNRDAKRTCNEALTHAMSTLQQDDEGYGCSVKDAWEAARKVIKYSANELTLLFNFSTPKEVISAYAPSEIIKRVTAYEISIKFGDMVKNKKNGKRGIVIGTTNSGVYVFYDDGVFVYGENKSDFEKLEN